MFSAFFMRVSFPYLPDVFDYYDYKRSRASENSFDRAESVSSPILDFGAGNYLPKFDRVASPKNFPGIVPEVAVIPNGPESVRPRGPDSYLGIGPDS